MTRCWLKFSILYSCPQSKEGDERKEEKLDYIIKMLDAERYEKLMKEWDDKYPGK